MTDTVKRNNIIVGCILSACATIAQYNRINALVIVCTVAYVLFAVSQPIESSMYFVAMGIPNTRVLGLSNISASIMICVLTAVKILVMKKWKINKRLFLSFMSFLIISIQFCFRASGVMYGIIFPIKTIFVLLYFFEILNFIPQNKYRFIKNTCDYLMYGSIILLTLSLFWNGLGGRLSVLKNDSNIMAIEMSFIVASYCVFYFVYEFIKIKEFIFVAGICSIVVFTTGSRMGILLLLIIVMLTVVMNYKRIGKMLWLAVIFVPAVGIFVSTDWAKNTWAHLMNRNQAMVQRGDISNGRYEAWNNYFRILTSDGVNALFGIGGNFEAYGVDSVAHNMILEDWANYGILGLVILIVVYLSIFKRIKGSVTIEQKGYAYVWLPFFIPIIGGITLHGLSSIPNTLMLFIGMMIVYDNKRLQPVE